VKQALITTLLCGALWAQAQDNSPALTIELHDDDTEEVTFQNLEPVSADLRAAVMAAAGCLKGSAFDVRRGNQLSLTCRHAVDRSGLLIATSWNLSPLAPVERRIARFLHLTQRPGLKVGLA